MSKTALNITVSQEGDVTQVVFEGEITETAEMDLVLDGIQKKAVFDLSGIKRVNSFGVRNWVQFMQALAEHTDTITFVNCAASMIRQFNMVPSTRKGARIQSFMLPFYCPDCDDEREVCLKVEGTQPPDEPPEEKCPECGEEMEFDDVPESYFSFWGADDKAFIDDS